MQAMSNVWTKWLVSPPAVWGKLPSHADYVRHRVGFREDVVWQEWLLRELGERAFNAREDTRRAPKAQGAWIQLDKPTSKPGPGQVPIAFALPSKALHHQINAHVIGVVARSEDSLGRVHPLIVYQFCSVRWLRQCFALPASDSHEVTLGWLYWLSRLMVRYIHPTTQPAMPVYQAVDELWDAFAPGWLHGLGVRRMPPSAAELNQWLQTAHLPDPPEQDAMQMLHGVRFLPWLDWPDRVWQGTLGSASDALSASICREPVKSYWQHDAAGGYVGASTKLPELWD